MAAASRIAKFRENRLDSIIPQLGKEGAVLQPKCCAGRSLAVFTSGGDSQGFYKSDVCCVRLLHPCLVRQR